MKIPFERLPAGFAERVADPPAEVAAPRPAATAVLVRDGADGPEILLLRRLRSAGFVPGAWVFPGGRVDAADGDDALLESLELMPEVPEPSYWMAVIREVFEETGVLLARHVVTGAACGDAVSDQAVARQREALLSDGATLHDVLRALDLRADMSALVYCAHWITPLAEPRRYDTRFFLAALPDGCTATSDAREMSDAVWLTSRDALARFRGGSLPMVFPTVKTLEMLEPHGTVRAMFDAFRDAVIPEILPRLVRLADGIGIVMPSEAEADMNEVE